MVFTTITQDQVNNLCAALTRQNDAGKPSDLLLAFRCYTMDVITYLCFGQSGNSVDQPDFHDPLVEAMHESSNLVPVFFHFKIIRQMIMGCPPELGKKMAPETAGLINMQQVCICLSLIYSLAYLIPSCSRSKLMVTSMTQRRWRPFPTRLLSTTFFSTRNHTNLEDQPQPNPSTKKVKH